ncbi:hypothetical protein [Jeongeupia sp. USM3]|uniref:hypothetical protein n=1 Tax=Jeongeupia sp. USM3 TaxID=1906741 RepID=UPI00089E071D|nr:hypothetical protein [Jeongeupia sp. USM3]AOY00701.1 hypothetical protein BJP62_09795 [Jeongeupia sp. USM3]
MSKKENTGKANEITPVTIRHVRGMTPAEMQYIKYASLGRRIERPFGLGFGVVIMMFGITLLVAFIYDGQASEPGKFIISVIFSIGFFLLGQVSWRTYKKRKYRLKDGVYEISGRLEEMNGRIVNPSTGGSSSVRKYVIGDTQIIWPIASSAVYASSAGSLICIKAAIFEKEKPVSFFSERSILSDKKHDAFVLEFDDKININRAIVNYGPRLFFKKRATLIATHILILTIIALGLFYFMENPFSARLPTPSHSLALTSEIIAITLFLITAAACLATAAFLYEKIAKKMGFTPYIEKLRS